MIINNFMKSYLDLINESTIKDYSSQIKDLETGLEELNSFIDQAGKNSPHLSKALKLKQDYEFQLKLYTQPVSVTCYYSTQEYPCAAAALDFYSERIKLLRSR